MSSILIIGAICYAVLGCMLVYRIAKGPTAADRLCASDSLDLLTSTALVLYSLYTGRMIFLDIAMIVAILGFAIAILLIIGVFFAFIGVLGILRMPDVFGRLQASTCIATLSTLCVNIAGILYIIQNGLSAGSAVKLGLLALFVLGTNPVSNHALCRAAYRIGCKPAKPFVIDDYKDDFGDSAQVEDNADKPDYEFDEPQKEDTEEEDV